MPGSRSRTAVFVACTLAVFLSACKPEIRIQAMSVELPAPVFGLSMAGDDRARFTAARIVHSDGTVLWTIRATVPGILSGGSELVYGSPPEGFDTVEGPAPLEAGVTYTLVLEGKGLGQARFTPTGDTDP